VQKVGHPSLSSYSTHSKKSLVDFIKEKHDMERMDWTDKKKEKVNSFFQKETKIKGTYDKTRKANIKRLKKLFKRNP